MNYFSDTHTFLWFVGGNNQLSPLARRLLADDNNTIWLSVASLWERAIKFSTGKLAQLQSDKPFAQHITDLLTDNAFQVLPVKQAHVTHIVTLPLHHRNPFDRLLVAQSHLENLPLISADTVLDAYSVQRLW